MLLGQVLGVSENDLFRSGKDSLLSAHKKEWQARWSKRLRKEGLPLAASITAYYHKLVDEANKDHCSVSGNLGCVNRFRH
jgi:hypothetical protein